MFGDRFVAADKQHSQEIVLHLVREEKLRAFLNCIGCFRGVLLEEATPSRSLAQLCYDIVVRHAKQPRRGIFR